MSDDKAAAAGKGKDAAPALKLTMPGQGDKTPGAGKLGLGLGKPDKADKAEKPATERKDAAKKKAAPAAATEDGNAEPAEKKAVEKKAPAKKPAAEKTDENSAEKPAAE
jgi:hypothetical protein